MAALGPVADIDTKLEPLHSGLDNRNFSSASAPVISFTMPSWTLSSNQSMYSQTAKPSKIWNSGYRI